MEPFRRKYPAAFYDRKSFLVKILRMYPGVYFVDTGRGGGAVAASVGGSGPKPASRV